MWRWDVLVMVVLLGFVAGIGCTQVAVTQNDTQAAAVLTGQDYAEIMQLFGRYNQGTDFRDATLWLSAFSADAVFQPGANAEEYVGQEALAEWRQQNFSARPAERQSRHWNSSWVITPTPSGAKGRAYYLVVDVSSGQPVLEGSGYYDDIYVRTSDGWRIQERRPNSDTAPQ